MTDNLLGTLPDGYWNRTASDSEEEKHSYVGRKVLVTTPKYDRYYGETLSVTRAYDSRDGVGVRIDFHDEYGTTLSLKPDEYKLIPEKEKVKKENDVER